MVQHYVSINVTFILVSFYDFDKGFVRIEGKSKKNSMSLYFTIFMANGQYKAPAP